MISVDQATVSGRVAAHPTNSLEEEVWIRSGTELRQKETESLMP